MLLGADVYCHIILEGLKKGPSLNKQNWDGFCKDKCGKTMRKQIEELPQERLFTKEEIDCKDFFAQTHRRDDSGRFVVGLPSKADSWVNPNTGQCNGLGS